MHDVEMRRCKHRCTVNADFGDRQRCFAFGQVGSLMANSEFVPRLDELLASFRDC